MRKILSFIKEWITNLFAIDEKKSSTIIVALFIILAMMGWELKTYQIINDNLRILALTCLLLIGGVNITGDIVSVILPKVTSKE